MTLFFQSFDNFHRWIQKSSFDSLNVSGIFVYSFEVTPHLRPIVFSPVKS